MRRSRSKAWTWALTTGDSRSASPSPPRNVDPAPRRCTARNEEDYRGYSYGSSLKRVIQRCTLAEVAMNVRVVLTIAIVACVSILAGELRIQAPSAAT